MAEDRRGGAAEEIERAFVVSVLPGAAKRWEREPEDMFEVVEATDGVLRASLAAFEGVEVRRAASDGFLLVFPDLPKALGYAAKTIALLAKKPGTAPVAFGACAGRAFARSDRHGRIVDLFGPDLGLATELAAGAPPGTVAVDPKAHARLAALGVPADVAKIVVAPGLQSKARGDDLIGRDRELKDLLARLRESRVVTIAGPGGIGKTRLARELLAMESQSLAVYGGHAFFVDLLACRDGDDLLREVAAVLSTQTAQGETTAAMIDRIAAALERRSPALVVLDNFEHLVEAAVEIVSKLVEATTDVRFVVTSRVRLHTAFESCVDLTSLSEDDGVSLFTRRALAGGAKIGADEAEISIIRDIVKKLDAIPLAIELAAARARVLPARVLRERLASGLHALASEREPGRGRTLRAVVQWSWDLLTPSSQRALARLATFRGGFPVEAAEAVLAFDPDESPIGLLEGLVDHSLVRVLGGTDTAPRFSLYETVRELAEERLRDDRIAAEIAHARFFVEAGEAWVREARFEIEHERLGRIAIERENLSAAAERMLTHDPALSARALLVVHVHAWMHGPLDPHVALLDRTIEALSAGEIDHDLLALLLQAHSECQRGRARMVDALEDGRRALVHAKSPLVRAKIASWLCMLKAAIGQAAEAREHGLEALATFEREHDVEGRAVTLGRIAYLDHGVGALEASADRYDAALALHDRLGSRRLSVFERRNYALLEIARGKHDRARLLLDRALEHSQLVSNPRQDAWVLAYLAIVELETGNHALAVSRCEEARAKALDSADRRVEALVTAQLAFFSYEDDDLAGAERLFEKVGTVGREAGDKVLAAFGWLGLALSRATVGDGQGAKRSLDHAFDVFPEPRPPWLEPSLRAVGQVLGILTADGKIGTEASPKPAAAVALPAPFIEAQFAMRLLQRALGVRHARASKLGVGLTEAESSLVMGPRCEWFRPPGGARVDLSRRHVLARILAVLVSRRKDAPGATLPFAELLEVGWPGEVMTHKAAVNRMHVAVSSLRRLGLGRALLTRADGYALDPAVRLLDDVE